jgi:hypothetical protein
LVTQHSRGAVNSKSSILQETQKNHYRYIVDFDGDALSDLSVFSLKERTLYSKSGLKYRAKSIFEVPLPILGDYNGDGKTDLAFFDRGFWFIPKFLITNMGKRGDIPVPADYDGDGKADLAIWRPRDGAWVFSSGKTSYWGETQDIPLPMDYDGDGRADIAIWRPSEGKWYIKNFFHEVSSVQWGGQGDIPVPGDFDGDGAADLAVWRPRDGIWYIRVSRGENQTFSWGIEKDFPVPGDYNGDGKIEPAVWRPSEGKWYILGREPVQFGSSGDIPIAWNIWVLWLKSLFDSPR